MKRRIIASLVGFVFLAVGISSMAQGKCLINRRDGKNIVCDAIAADAVGNLTFKEGNFTQKIRAQDYYWARIPKPREITAVEGMIRANKYAEAAAQLRQLYDKYRFVGYDVLCIYYESMCLTKLDKNAEAIKRLELLDDFNLQEDDPSKEAHYFECRKLLAELYIQSNQFAKADKVLAELGSSKNENHVGFAFNARGDILYRQKKSRDAVLMYLRTVLLLPPTNQERPQAILKVANTLREMNDNRASIFADMLKQDYPGSKLINELK